MRDIDATVTLYIPFSTARHGRWRVLEGVHPMGAFPSRGESLSFAVRLAREIVSRRMVQVRLLIEEDDGGWVCLPPDGDVLDEPLFTEWRGACALPAS